ncbi:lmo0937 family membrane protein [Phenylobacterium sp.]|jgi:Flp pilus assembly protein TadB
MLLIIAVVLVALWLLGFLAFHVTTAAIHVILLIALVLVVMHFVRARRTP